MAYNMTGGIGGALSEVGGNLMQMGFRNIGDKKAEQRKKMADEAMKALEEARVARTESYLKKGDPKAQSPWISKEAANYASPQGTPDEVRVQEYNSQNKPLGTRPGTEAETQSYLQNQNALAAQQKKAEFDMNRQNVLDNSRLTRDQSAAAADLARVENLNARTRNPERFRSNPAEPKGPDYDKMIDNANRVLGSIEDPEVKAGLQAQVNEAIAKMKPNPDGSPGVDSQVAAQMLMIALRNAREAEAMKGGKKPSSGNSAEPTSSGQKL